jgi:hypothetical protein
VDGLHYQLRRDGFGRRLRLAAPVAAGGMAVGEHAEDRAHDDLRQARQQRLCSTSPVVPGLVAMRASLAMRACAILHTAWNRSFKWMMPIA